MRPVWLEQSERGGEREEERPGRGQGRSCRAGGRIWIFTPRRSVGRGGLGPDSDAHEHPLRSLLQVGQMGWGWGAVKMSQGPRWRGLRWSMWEILGLG